MDPQEHIDTITAAQELIAEALTMLQGVARSTRNGWASITAACNDRCRLPSTLAHATTASSNVKAASESGAGGVGVGTGLPPVLTWTVSE